MAKFLFWSVLFVATLLLSRCGELCVAGLGKCPGAIDTQSGGSGATLAGFNFKVNDSTKIMAAARVTSGTAIELTVYNVPGNLIRVEDLDEATGSITLKDGKTYVFKSSTRGAHVLRALDSLNNEAFAVVLIQ